MKGSEEEKPGNMDSKSTETHNEDSMVTPTRHHRTLTISLPDEKDVLDALSAAANATRRVAQAVYARAPNLQEIGNAALAAYNILPTAQQTISAIVTTKDAASQALDYATEKIPDILEKVNLAARSTYQLFSGSEKARISEIESSSQKICDYLSRYIKTPQELTPVDREVLEGLIKTIDAQQSLAISPGHPIPQTYKLECAFIKEFSAILQTLSIIGVKLPKEIPSVPFIWADIIYLTKENRQLLTLHNTRISLLKKICDDIKAEKITPLNNISALVNELVSCNNLLEHSDLESSELNPITLNTSLLDALLKVQGFIFKDSLSKTLSEDLQKIRQSLEKRIAELESPSTNVSNANASGAELFEEWERT